MQTESASTIIIPKIMLVDKNEKVREKLVKALGNQFDVQQFSSLNEALSEYNQKQGQFDVVICADTFDTWGDGARWLQSLKQVDQRIVLFSGQETDCDIPQINNLDFRAEEVVQFIRRVIETVVDRIFASAKQCLDDDPGQDSASKVLYLLSLAVCSLGRDKPEEAKLFKAKWGEVKDRLANMAGRDEFLSNGKMIEDSIDQVVNPTKHKYVTNRGYSTLETHEVELIEGLAE